MCRCLGLSTSGLYAWQQRGRSARACQDVVLTAAIQASHVASDGTYGAPRIRRDLREAGHAVGQKRVARLMRAAAVVGVSRRRWVTTTQRAAVAPAVPDLVQRDFTAPAPNRL
jgi:putative transposase